MSAQAVGLLFMVAAVTVESAAQLALKVGASGGPSILPDRLRRLAASVPLGGVPAGWIAAGVAGYAVVVAFYTAALHRLDLSVAFPVGSLCFVGVALLSRFLLGERVGPARWAGIGCIVGGAALVALGQP